MMGKAHNEFFLCDLCALCVSVVKFLTFGRKCGHGVTDRPPGGMLTDMLKRTFIHLPGVGPRREAHFWSQGVETWEDFLAAQWISGLSRERFRSLQSDLRESVEHAAEPAYFAPLLAAQ